MFGLPRWKISGTIALALMVMAMVVGCLALTEGIDHGVRYGSIVSMSIGLMGLGTGIILIISLLLDDKDDNGVVYFTALIITNSLVLFLDLVGTFLDGRTDYMLIIEFCNFSVHALNILATLEFWLYLTFVLNVRSRLVDRTERLFFIIFVLSMALLVVNQFTGVFYYVDSYAHFQVTDLNIILYLVPFILMVLCLYPVYRLVPDIRKKLALSSYILLPFLGGVLNLFAPDLNLLNIFILFSLLIVFGNFYVRRSEDLMKKDAELVQQRAEVLVSQIRPHFLYNSLTSIMNIKGTPMATRDAIVDFAKFMRGNLDTLSLRSAIPIMKEVEHVETYLLLNKLEMKGLEYTLEIRDREFLIPAQTLQVLVENSLQHGFKGRADGHIIIRTEETETSHNVMVIDDGAGFDISKYVLDRNEARLGLSSIYMRVKDMVGGTIDITSSPENGTVATVIIPKSGSGRHHLLQRR
ncbi:MAG: histidine kinase [archaeon]|nr:histidine kinase [archaeon]